MALPSRRGAATCKSHASIVRVLDADLVAQHRMTTRDYEVLLYLSQARRAQAADVGARREHDAHPVGHHPAGRRPRASGPDRAGRRARTTPACPTRSSPTPDTRSSARPDAPTSPASATVPRALHRRRDRAARVSCSAGCRAPTARAPARSSRRGDCRPARQARRRRSIPRHDRRAGGVDRVRPGRSRDFYERAIGLAARTERRGRDGSLRRRRRAGRCRAARRPAAPRSTAAPPGCSTSQSSTPPPRTRHRRSARLAEAVAARRGLGPSRQRGAVPL